MGRELHSQMLAPTAPDRRSKPHPKQNLKCPRCDSVDTKFCYYNNYSLTQPRYFCKCCKRYWTAGGALRNVPVGGGLRKNKRSKQKTVGQHAEDAGMIDDRSPAVAHPTLSSSEGSPHRTSASLEVANFRFSDFRYSNSPHPFDSSRMFEAAGEEASLGSSLQYFGYGQLRNAPQYFPRYSFGLALEGIPQNEASLVDYTLAAPVKSEQPQQSNSGEMSEVLESTLQEAVEPSCNSHHELEHHGSVDQQRQSRYNHSTKANLPAGNELLHEPGKIVNNDNAAGAGTQEAGSDEASSGLNFPYSYWQHLSDGSFGGTADFFSYTPGTSDWSHFDSGPS